MVGRKTRPRKPKAAPEPAAEPKVPLSKGGRDLARLKAGAAALAEVSKGLNVPFPEAIRREQVQTLCDEVQALDTLEGSVADQLLLQVHDTLRHWTDHLAELADEVVPDQGRIALALLGTEVDRLTRRLPPARVLDLAPDPKEEPLVARREDIRRVEALAKMTDAGQVTIIETEKVIHQHVTYNVGLVNVGGDLIRNVSVGLKSMRASLGTLRVQLTGWKIELTWLAKAASSLAKLTGRLGGWLDKAKKAEGGMAWLVERLGAVRRSVDRVVRVTKLVFSAIKRRLGGGSYDFPDLHVFRDRLADGSFGPEMVVIPAGSFLMGSPEDEEGRDQNEGPQSLVSVPRFALGRYPVTFEEYDRYCAVTETKKPGDMRWGRGRRPVASVSWHDATSFCVWLSSETGRNYRLPSEAEWEYACGAGTVARYSWGNSPPDAAQANFGSNVGKTTIVGTYPANPWKLHDMHGNVLEWCEDRFRPDYNFGANNGSSWIGDSNEQRRVMRGGAWNFGDGHIRSSSRSFFHSNALHNGNGFRVAMTLGV